MKRTLEQIEDGELARLFVYKNIESTETTEATIDDIFVHSREEFFVNNPAPSQELYSKLSEETGKKASITTSLEKAMQSYKDRKQMIKKVNEVFSLQLRKPGQMLTMNIPFLGADYRYFYSYLNVYKKEMKSAISEFNSFVEVSLKAANNFAKLRKFEIGGAGIMLFLLSLLLFGKTFLRNWKDMKNASNHTAFFQGWLDAIVILSSIAAISVVFPYITLGIFYFININYLYQSKYFHYFLFLCSFASLVLFLLAFFNFLFFQWIQVTGGWGIVNLNVQSTSAK
ncbi:hypothetical protein MHLP_00625 [Candidatus Mycoplasma haematolamae str. Purdue]|uniref:Uncharacterized protein n=1 Tax=Mycoplasma haematolamae (strain Purdue) TaxID=1212765 RepID=I7B8Y1_MYCHA|nr:hypothetical protein [Candidatus Mycoplasma haematolamae]AFO51705.1 hypothetical protein MHLP_00625 [Candidatus Mycoplasma haematolamae str. Purdue]